MGVIKRYAPEVGPGFSTLAAGQPSSNISQTNNVVVSLTAAQIIAMGTTPITIIPAPGTGLAIIVDEIVAELILTATAFTTGGVVHFYYHGQTTEIMAQTIAAATVNGAAGTTVWQLEPAQTAGGNVITPAVGVDITNATAPFAAGTGTAKLFIRYRTITL